MRRRGIGTSIKGFFAVYGVFAGAGNPSLYHCGRCVTLGEGGVAEPQRRAKMSLTIKAAIMITRIVVIIRARGFGASRVVG
jgi:hypothetical protein